MTTPPTPVKELPKVASELIYLALRELERVEQSPDCMVVMGTWFSKEANKPCAVCLAGAVMWGYLGGKEKAEQLSMLYVSPSQPDYIRFEHQLFALDYFRCGEVEWGLEALGVPFQERRFNRDIVEYDDNPQLFKLQMRELASALEASGL